MKLYRKPTMEYFNAVIATSLKILKKTKSNSHEIYKWCKTLEVISYMYRMFSVWGTFSLSLSPSPFCPSCCSHLEHRASVKCFVSLQFLNPKTIGRTPWTGGSARRKAATYTNTEYAQTNIHALRGIRTHDPTVWASEDSSCLRRRGDCDQQRNLAYTGTRTPAPRPPSQ
jgi:hypothetical protein